MWVATDGCEGFGFCDGLWHVETEGHYRGLARHFLSCPKGAELCGPEFTPDGNTLFVSIQHPGDSDGCSKTNPSSRWPHFDKNLPPLPSVVAISKSDNY
jgi:secreted PhoX family phosphatase